MQRFRGFKGFLFLMVFLPVLVMGEKIVLVGGLDVTTGKCKNIEKTHEYYDWCTDGRGYLTRDEKLGNSLNNYKDNILKEDIYEFIWSQDPIPHEENYNAPDGSEGTLKKKFEDWFYEEVCEFDKLCEVSFIAHSWGTIITSDFIASQYNPNLKIKKVITYASPVTGAQIDDGKEPFWETAVNNIKGMNGKWINVVNTRDVLAWDIPDAININEKGFLSHKGKIPEESFPVNNSELDLQGLITNIHVMRGIDCYFQEETYENMAGCLMMASNIDDILNKNYITPVDLNNLNEYFETTHFTEVYEPDRLVSYLLIDDMFIIKYFKNNFGVKYLGLPLEKSKSNNGYVCQNFEHGSLVMDKTYETYKITNKCEELNFNSNLFLDVSDTHKYYHAIKFAKNIRLIEGYRNSLFKPEKTINRAEFAKIIANYNTPYTTNKDIGIYKKLGFTELEIPQSSFADILNSPTREWYHPYVVYMEKKGFMEGYPINSKCDNNLHKIWEKDRPFCPGNNIKLSEASKVIVKVLINENIINHNSGEWWKNYFDELREKQITEKELDMDPNHLLTRSELVYIICKIKGDEQCFQ